MEVEKLCYSIAEATHATGLGKTSIYKAIKTKQLKSVFFMGRRFILKEDLIAFLHAGRDGKLQ